MTFVPEMREYGLAGAIYAPVRGWSPAGIGRRALRTMSPFAQYAASAAGDALTLALLRPEDLPPHRTAAVVGTEFAGIREISHVERILNVSRGPAPAGAAGILRMMASSASANIASLFGITGRVYTLSSSFASGPDAIGHGCELIRYGLADVCLAGAAEEALWRTLGPHFENWKATAIGYDDRPCEACRPYAADRAGFVLSEGAGMLVLEEWQRAVSRGAPIYAEIVGTGSSNDGSDLFRPSGTGLKRALRAALNEAASRGIDQIDYVNTHGSGTVLGDRIEVEVLKDVFGPATWVSSTKGLSGHGMGAAGAQEAIYTLLMLNGCFIAPTANLRQPAPECDGVRHVMRPIVHPIRTAMSFNVGLGGANSCVIFRKGDVHLPIAL